MTDPAGENRQRRLLTVPFLSLVREVAADAAAQSDPDTCLRHLRAGLLRMGFSRAAIWVGDPDDPTRSRGTWGTSSDGTEIDEHGRSMSNDQLFGADRLSLSQAVIPLRTDGVVVGIISVDTLPTNQSIDPEHLVALEIVADIVAVAIARGRLVERLRITNQGLRAAVAVAREAAGRYRTASELGSDYTYVLKVESDGIPRLEWITDSVERVIGYTAAELIASGGNPALIHPDDLPRVLDNAEAVLAGATTTIEHRIVTKAGACRWIRTQSRPGWDDQHDRVMRLYSAAHDITDQKRSAAALQLREQSFRLLFESNPHPMWVYDLETLRFLAVNAAAVGQYGYSRAEFLAMTILNLMILVDVHDVASITTEFRGVVSRAGWWRQRRKDGSTMDVQISSKALEFEGHHAAVSVGFDLTEQNRATEALRESEERFRYMAEATGHALYRLHYETMRYDYLSPAIEHLTGYTATEISNNGWSEIIRRRETPRGQPWDIDSMTRKRLSGDGIPFHAYYLIQTKAGVNRWLEDRSEPWRDSTGKVIGSVGVLSDITERQNLEEQVRQAQKMEAVGQLAGGVAHEFNNLLTVIGGYSELLLDQLNPAALEHTEVEQILQASAGATSLTRQLLALSGQQIITPRKTDLNAVIDRLSTMLRQIVGEDITFSTVLASRLWDVQVDPGQIEQVLLNLTTNARDAMPRGGRLTIQTRNVDLNAAHVRNHPDAKVGPHIAISVRDTGIGMDEATRSHIFEPFFTTKEIGKGTGLGLAAVYGIVRQSDGSIGVASAVGSGTTFTIYLPPAGSLTPSAVPTATLSTLPVGTETIIVVEDAADVRNLARLALEAAGYRVLAADGGEQAFDLVQKYVGPIHLLITDVVMPTINGGLVAKRLSEQRPELKVLYISGYNEDIIVRNGVIEGRVAFLAKPFTPATLTRKVRDILDHESNDSEGTAG